MEVHPLSEKEGNPEINEVRLDLLQIGDRVQIDTTSRRYFLYPLPSGGTKRISQLIIGKKNETTGSVEEWIDYDTVEVMGACLKYDPDNGDIPVVDFESGVIQAGKKIWYRANRKNLNSPVNVITGSVDSLSFSSVHQ